MASQELPIDFCEVEKVANPKVSIIIPVFYADRFHEDVLRSVSGQTFDDFQCIVISDGSTEPPLSA